ncbi:hypothetical protein Scep_008802 [Stephania cephalantha]|uniref:Uncharacterized protein n=1 Tax=Stephania cephalantha TaxID=152367 RepID=A0AAP0PFP9_9MAGN
MVSLVLSLFVSLLLSCSVTSECILGRKITPVVIFNFGDSNSDTGGLSSALGFNIGLPNGRVFFHRSSGRLCDGRLVIDFLCESLKTSFLTPYLEPMKPNFTNGANFAISGASTMPEYVPFALDVQVLQFLRFKTRSLQLVSQGEKDLVGEEGFQNAIYTIDIGQNDLSAAFASRLSYNQRIYEDGGRNFWAHNTGPLGCLPQKLASLSKINNPSILDQYGCIRFLNDAAQVFNQKLRTLCNELRLEMKNAAVVYIDVYSIKYELIANATNYGFVNPHMACCGYGGAPYNYNSSVGCGRSGSNICNEGSRYVSWDGVHYTEAANAIVASMILSTHYSTPPLKFGYFCTT